jgi:hypothetical protein
LRKIEDNEGVQDWFVGNLMHFQWVWGLVWLVWSLIGKFEAWLESLKLHWWVWSLVGEFKGWLVSLKLDWWVWSLIGEFGVWNFVEFKLSSKFIQKSQLKTKASWQVPISICQLSIKTSIWQPSQNTFPLIFMPPSTSQEAHTPPPLLISLHFATSFINDNFCRHPAIKLNVQHN